MPCCGNRRKKTREFADQKWEYINLRDFKAGGVGPGFAYAYLWCSLIISIAVYSVDSFTAVQLLAFNRWSSAIEPKIPLNISKWIFSGCIIMSFVNLGYEAIRATRVMKRGNIAECYMDSLAVRWECIRVGNGQGWRRFLVFSALTKGKKGAEYIALFTYFSFQAWIRVLICSAPRQVVNAFTLKSVYEAKLATNSNNVGANFTGFFDKIKFLAEEDYRQAAILSGMAFTFVIWVFSVLYLLLAVLFYVFFLFHWIPRADGGLTGYCERKVNKALLKIVAKRVNKALAKNEAKAAMAFGEKPPHLDRAATLPNVGPINNDALPQMPTAAHHTTASFNARSPSIEMSPLDGSRNGHMRTGTANSNSSFGANASLIRGAADMGYARTESPAPSLPPMDLNNMPPQRPNTSNSQRGYRPGGPPGYPNAMPVARPGMGNAADQQHNMRPRPGPPGYPNNSSDPQYAPGHEASHYLGAPTLPNLELGGDSTRTPVDSNLNAVAREPTIPDLAAGMPMAPQRTGTSNSQRPPAQQQPHHQQHGAPGPSFVDDFTVSPELAGEPRFPTNGRMGANGMYANGRAPGATRAPPQAHYQPYNPHGYAAAASTGNPYDCDELASQRGTPVAGGIGSPMNGEDWAPTRNRSNPGPARMPHRAPQRNMTGPNPMTVPLGGPSPNMPSGQYPPSRSGTGAGQDMRNYPQRQMRGPPGYPNGPPRTQPQPGYGYDVEAQQDRW